MRPRAGFGRLVTVFFALAIGGVAQEDPASDHAAEDGASTLEAERKAEAATMEAWFGEMHEAGLAASRVQDRDSSGVARASSRFGVDLLRELVSAEPAANHLVAPLGAFINLSLASEGASPNLRERLAAALHVRDLDRPSLRRAIGALRSSFAARETVDLGVAASVWLREGLQPAPDFVAAASDGFGAMVNVIDFKRPEALEAFNAWASTATGGALPEALTAMDPSSQCLVATATHFEATWSLAFPEEDSKPGDFTRADGGVSQPVMMNLSWCFPYVHDEALGAQIVALECGNEEHAAAACSLHIVLPDADRSIRDVLDGLAEGPLAWRFAQLAPHAGRVSLPRFEVQSRASLTEAIGHLVPQGLATGGLNGVAQGQSLDLDLRTNSRLRVDEQGLHFASVEATTVFGSMDELPGFAFIANRPFLYFLFDRTTGALLCAGVLAHPD